MMRRRPHDRAGRRLQTKQAGQLAYPVLVGIALCGHPPLAGPQQPGQGRAAQIDDQIPAAADCPRIERQPMQGPAPLLQHDQPLEPGDRLEQRRRRRSDRDGQASVRETADEVGQKTGRKHGIADAGRGHEQDAHVAAP